MNNSSIMFSFRKRFSVAVFLLFVIQLSCLNCGTAMDFGAEEVYGEERPAVKSPAVKSPAVKSPAVKSPAVKNETNETIIEIKTNSTVTPLSEPEVQHARDLEAEKRFPEIKSSAMVSGEDPCEDFKSCSDCTRQRQCGWCEANKKCVTGGPKRPKADNVCPIEFWEFSFCPSIPCPQYSDCRSCLMDPNCGWCAGSKSDESDDSSIEGKCQVGGNDGPRDQTEDAMCHGNWLHSPTRIGESTTRTAILNLKHGRYLTEVCNAGTMLIQHALPPKKILAPVKYPTTLSIDPVHGPTFGTTVVTITGLWFGFTPSAGLKAYLGEIPCDETIWVSESIIKCVTPQHRPAGMQRVIVIRDGIGNNDTDAQNVVNFEYREMIIDRISTNKGPTVGGTIINITGKNFGTKDYNPTVKVGDKECVRTHWLSNEVVQCVTPPNFGYNHSIVLTINGMEQPISNQRFFFDYERPTIETTSAKHGPTTGNTTVVVRGTNFGTIEAMPVVTIGGVPCMSQEQVDHSEIVCSTSPGVGRNHRVVVTLLDGRYTTAEEFTFNYDPPIIATVTPANGVTLGRYEVLIAGINFGTGASSPDLTPPVADWTHRRLKYAQDRAGVKESWGVAWNNTGVGDQSWEPSVEEKEADALAGSMKNDTTVKNGLFAAAEAAARGDVAAASMSVAKASEDAVNKLKKNLKGEALAAAMAVADIVKTSVTALSNVSKTMETGSFSGSALKRVIGASVAAATGKPYTGENGDEDRLSNFSKSKTAEDADGYDWKKDRTLVGKVHNLDGTTETRVGAPQPTLFVELAEKTDSGMGLFQAKLYELYSFIENVDQIMKLANNNKGSQQAGLANGIPDFGSASEYGSKVSQQPDFGSASEYGSKVSQQADLNQNSTTMGVTANGTPDFGSASEYGSAPDFGSAVDESKHRECFFTTGCTKVWTPQKDNEIWEERTTVMSIEGMKVGMRYKVEIKGLFFADNSAKSYGAECPSVTGVGDAREITCPTFYTPKDHLPQNKLYLAGKDKTMQKGKRFPATMTFEGEATSETLSFRSMHAKNYYIAMTPIQMRVVQLSPRMRAPIIAEPACPNNMAPDYTMAGARCIYASIGGQSCLQLEMMTSGMLKCTVPPGVGANLTVAVVVGNQTSTDMGNYERITRLHEESSIENIVEHLQFSYDKPVVMSYHPKNGPTSGGNTITLKGYNFGPDKDHIVQNLTTVVTIGGVLCTSTLWLSDKTIECKVPEGVGSRKEIVVTTAGQMFPPEGEACTKCNACCKPIYYDYNGPIIRNVSPNHGTTVGGTNVAIYGKNFGAVDHMPTVTIDGEPCPQIMWKSDELILCASPSGWGTGKEVKVTVGDQMDRDYAMWNYDIPEVHSVEPSVCPTRGDCLLKIRGLNYGHEQGNHLRAYVGGKPCANVDRHEQPLLVNQTSMECVVPSGVGKKLDVKICVGAQCSKENDYFSYRRPEVYEIRPRHAPLRGGKVVTITGMGFGQSGGSNATLVARLGGIPCADTRWLSNDQVECTVPKHHAGGFDLPVTVLVGNQESVGEELFQAAYFSYDAPEIHEITMKHGPVMGGYVMELLGFNFPSDTTIWFGEMAEYGREHVPCTKTKRVSSEILKCLVPCGIGFGLLPDGDTGFGTEEKTASNGAVTLTRQHSIHLVTNGRRFVQTKTKPKNKIRKCLKLPEIFAMKQMGDKVGQGNYATLFCEKGYDLIGNGSFVCNATTGSWTGKLPRCLKPKAPKPSLPFDVFGVDIKKALEREAQRERAREGTGQAQRYDAEAKKLREAATTARASGKLMEAIGLEKQAEGMEKLAMKEAKASSSSQAKQLEADSEEAEKEVEELKRAGKLEEAKAKEKQVELLKRQAKAMRDMSASPEATKLTVEAEDIEKEAKQLREAGKVEKALEKEKEVEELKKKAEEANKAFSAAPEPLTAAQTISKAEIAAMAQQESMKKLLQATIREQAIERNNTAAMKEMDKQSEMIIAKKEKYQEDIDAATKARKKALEDEQKAMEEQQKAAKGAAARAAFEAMNSGTTSEDNEDSVANALNPALGEQKNAQIKLLRTKAKELLQAARMKKLQKEYAAAVKRAKGKMTYDRKITLQKLNEEVKRTEKIQKKAKEQEDEESKSSQKANAKQARVQEDTRYMIEAAKDADVGGREDEQRTKLEDTIKRAEKFEAALPGISQVSAEQSSLRNRMASRIQQVKSQLEQELTFARVSPAKVNTLTEQIEALEKQYAKYLQKETENKALSGQAKRAGESVRDTRKDVAKKMAELSKERAAIYKLRRRLLWHKIAAKIFSPSSNEMRFSNVRSNSAASNDGEVNVLKAFDAVTGELLTEYYDDNSPQGMVQDKDMFYRLKGGMVVDYRFDFDAPTVRKAYIVGSRSEAHVGANGHTKIIVEGRNFGCRDYAAAENKDRKNNYTFWESIEEEQKLTAWVFETDSSASGKGWNKCLETTYVSDGRLECTSPSGTGKGRKMKVTLGGQGSAPKVLFNYDAPVVTRVINAARNNIRDNRCTACGAPSGEYWVTIEGYNFGPTRTTWGLEEADESRTGPNDRPNFKNEHYSDKPVIKIGDTYCIRTRYISDTKAQCLVPPGLGKNHLISVGPVNGLYSHAEHDGVKWEYERPVVHTIMPRNGQTFGNETTKIYGENFGRCFDYNYVSLKGVKGPSTHFCPPVYPSIDCEPCKSFTRINSRLIECVTSDGVGVGKFVNVKLGEYDVEKRNGLFNYNGPMVTKVRPLHGPATGGNVLDITGINFGTNIDAIMTKGCSKGNRPYMAVGQIRCADFKILSNTKAKCTLSNQPGIGKNLPIGLTVGGQGARENRDPDAVYTFDAPEIDKIVVLKTTAPNTQHLNAISPHGYNWVFKCDKPNGGCVDADSRWSREDYSFKIYGKNFGARIYNQGYGYYRGYHQCGFGNFRGSARYISDSEIICSIPQNQQAQLARGANGLKPFRAYVTVAKQSSFRPGIEASKGPFYETRFFEYKNTKLQGTPLILNEAKPLAECKKKCASMPTCGAITLKSGKCTYYTESAVTTCSASKTTGVATYIKEDITDTGDCVDTGSLVLGPIVTSAGPSSATEGTFDKVIRITGKNFGLSKDSTRAKSIKAYYNSEECLSTEYVSDTEVLCKPRQYQNSTGGVVLAEDFEGAQDTNKWKSTNGKPTLGGQCASGSAFGKAMVFGNNGEIISNPVNVLRGGKVSFYLRLCGFGHLPKYAEKGVTLSASVDGGATWIVVAGFNTYHKYRSWRKISIDLYNDNRYGSHPAASASTMFKWSGPKMFAIDEVKITSEAVKWPVQVTVNVNSPTPEKNVTMASLYMGLNKATSYSTAPEFRTSSTSCTVGKFCHMPSKTNRYFPGFTMRKNRYDDLVLSGSLKSCSSAGQSEGDMSECMKLLKHDGKKSTFTVNNFSPGSTTATVNVKFSFPVLVYQLRLVHAEANKEECRPKTLLLKYPGGERKVEIEDTDKELNGPGNGYFKQYEIAPFAADDISIFTVETQNNCKKAKLSIGQISLRGNLLSNVNRRASWSRYAWQSCSSNKIGDYNLGRYYSGFWAKSESKFSCRKIHNGVYDESRMTIDGQAWATPYPNKASDRWNSRPTGRPPLPAVTINFNRPQDLWGINIAQKHRYHAKSVTVSYYDESNKRRGKPEKIVLSDKDFLLQKFQLSVVRKQVKKVTIKIDDVHDSLIRAKFPYLYDIFKKLDGKNWIFPKKKSITYDYGLENQVGHAKGIYFSGDAENQLAIYSAKAWPATGTTIVGAVVGAPGKCNDHFVMISTKPQQKWSFGHSPDILKFAYNCEELAIYQMEEKSRGRRRAKTVPCRPTGKKHRFEIKLDQNGIGFTSDACANAANSAIPNNSGWARVYDNYNPFATKSGEAAKDVYVYFGASQDRKQESQKPYFEMMKIVSAGYGLGEVELIGEPAVDRL